MCTECGLPVVRSLGRDNALWEARPRWLRSLSCGVGMLIAAQTVLAGAIVAVAVGPRWVERLFNKLKQFRRIATRYDKLGANFFAFVKLASMRIWLRSIESTA